MIVNNYNEFVAPGTTMEFENPNRNNAVEKVIVLTDNKVMYTMLGGEPHREIMALADWLIQAMGCAVKMSNSSQQLPLGPPPPLLRVATDAGMDLETQPIAPEPVYTVGTKFSYKIDDDNRRTAVMTKNGVLQVFQLTNGVSLTNDVTRHGFTFPRPSTKMFDTLQQWKASLPGGGIITITPYTSVKDSKKAQPITATNDYELIQAINQRWRVCNYGYVMPSLVEQMAHLEQFMDRDLCNRATLTRDDPQYSLKRRRFTTYIRQTRNKIARIHNTISNSTPEESNKRYPRIQWLSGSTLFGNIRGSYIPIICDRSGNIMTPSTYGPTLQSIGVQMNSFGKPDFMVRWRGKEVILNDKAD